MFYKLILFKKLPKKIFGLCIFSIKKWLLQRKNKAFVTLCNCFDELGEDDAEVVRMHMRTHLEGKTCSSSQTEKVVVLEDEMEIIDLISSYQRKKTADSTTQTVDIRTTDGCNQTRGKCQK